MILYIGYPQITLTNLIPTKKKKEYSTGGLLGT